MKAGDIIHIKNDAGGQDWYWFVHAFCSGAEGQRSVIAVSQEDGREPVLCETGHGTEKRQIHHVPSMMIRKLIECGGADVIEKFPEYDVSHYYKEASK